MSDLGIKALTTAETFGGLETNNAETQQNLYSSIQDRRPAFVENDSKGQISHSNRSINQKVNLPLLCCQIFLPGTPKLCTHLPRDEHAPSNHDLLIIHMTICITCSL